MGDQSKAPSLSRLAKMRLERGDADYQPEMPAIGTLGYIVKYFYEIGPVMAAGSGAGPLTHGEIMAWCQLTQVWLQPWESRLIRSLSLEYLLESNKAVKWDAPAPWQSNDVKPELSPSQVALRSLARL